MRRCVCLFAAAGLLAAYAAVPAQAQTSPPANQTVDQMIKTLTPTPSGAAGANRGIRLGNQPSSGSQAPGNQAPAASKGPSLSVYVTFASGSAVLRPKAKEALNTLGLALSDPSFNPYRFRIEGHTDTVGTPDDNRALSERRAQAVVDYLVHRFSIDPKRLQPVGVGQEGLAVQTPDQTPEPRNRRVLVVTLAS